jgi:hypothetical protein
LINFLYEESLSQANPIRCRNEHLQSTDLNTFSGGRGSFWGCLSSMPLWNLQAFPDKFRDAGNGHLLVFEAVSLKKANWALRILQFKWFALVAKLFITVLGVGILCGQLQAQFGNEWIRYNQQYVKIPVAQEGIYRVSLAALETAGLPLFDPDKIQLWHRGQQHARRIVPGQYIEFYGQKNDGTSDTPLYNPASAQPHTYYNLFSDTTSYFLTVNTQGQSGVALTSYSEINNSGIPSETFHKAEKLLVLTNQYSTGVWYNTYAQQTAFETGEGWIGAWINKNQFIDYTIQDIRFPVTTSGNPQIQVQVVGQAGNTSLTHRVEISVGPSTPSRVVATQDFATNTATTVTATLNWTDISAEGNVVVRVKALGIDAGGDRLSTAYIKITFPQNFNLNGATEKIINLEPNAGNKSFIQLQNAPAGLRLFDVTDSRNPVIIGTTSTTTLNAVVNNTSVARKIFAASSVITPVVKKVTFRQLFPDPTKNTFVVVSHRLLMTPAGSYANPVKAYAGYRASAEGGGYDTLVMEMNQLYNQFNYGEISPLAIRRFMAYMLSTGNPHYLFLIGKGLDIHYNYHRNPGAFTTLKDLVPIAGMPASDMAFTAGLRGNGFEPAVPTGRITASTPQEVASYLNKVKEMEALPFDDLWRKEVLHLSGGLYPGEPELFKSYLDQFGEIAKDHYLGGTVSSIAKNNTEIEFINISDKVNSGVNLVTLFGHSDPSSGDFNIGYVSAQQHGYNNTGKYPMFLINGCNAGEFFSATNTRYGEDWILTPSKGAVGFIAHTSFGFASLLRAYSNTFYAVGYGSEEFINKGVGDVQKEVARRFTDVTNSVLFVTQAQQMLLLGDPAVKLFGANKPDYAISNNQVYVEPFGAEPVTARSDSFAIKMIIRNFGIATKDSLAVRVTRTFEDNTSVTYDSVYAPVLHRDTLVFKIVRDDRGYGDNTFTITIDPLQAVTEIIETNNTAELTFFVSLNAARNLFPQNFAIVSSPTVGLTVQSTDMLDAARDFIVEIDTVNTFNSPFVQQYTVNGKVATKEIPLYTGIDTLAYYWRTRLAQPHQNESDAWATASFTYINNGPEGWAQVHFPQMLSNPVNGLTLHPESRAIKFKETVTDISVLTFGSLHPFQTEISVKLNGTEYNPRTAQEAACRNNTINLMAFDKTTTAPYLGYIVIYPNVNVCGRRPEVIASYTASEVETGNGHDLIQYVDNVQLGDSVVLFSIGNPGWNTWSTNVRNKLGELGIASAQLDEILPNEPIIIFAKKGAQPGTATIYKTNLPPENEQALLVERTITGRFVSGTMASTVIGPATAWQQLQNLTQISELPQTDDFKVDIMGRSLSGEETELKSDITEVETDLSDIDAGQYPYLVLRYTAIDEFNLTPPQLTKWLVSYTPAAEGIIVYDGTTEQQTLQEGETWSGNFGFQNISQKHFTGPLTVQYSFNNTTQRKLTTLTHEIEAPVPGEKTDFTLTASTLDNVGINTLKVFVNPRVLPELYYDNNVLEFKDVLNVTSDQYNPVLDVRIDGRYILNKDFVSSSPVIAIRLWDENRLILKTDTLGMNIFLRYPCAQGECPYKTIYFSRPDVTWSAATTISDFQVEFIPQNLPEGTYALRIVARDARNNISGSQPYEINFQVAADNTVTILPAYPNPSTTGFFFDVVVRGDQPPDVMQLQIINSNGAVVNEFINAGFHTGTNSVMWDGADAGGNMLPGGLYLYRVKLLRDGQQLKAANGKLVLLR